MTEGRAGGGERGGPQGWTEDPASWPPPEERRRAHWVVENELRGRLLACAPDERERVAAEVYDELFRRVPWHAANLTGDDPSQEELCFRAWSPLLRPDDVLVDLGCGTGALVNRFAPAVARAIGVDASRVMVEIGTARGRPNAEWVVGSAVDPPLPDRSADFVISRQVLEHLHPDDAPSHVRSARRLLRPGGRFLLETPSGLTGPWDVSRGFTASATGFHLYEYTLRELDRLFRGAGFARVMSPVVPGRVLAGAGVLRRHLYRDARFKRALEDLMTRAPRPARLRLAPLAALSVLCVVGQAE